jgi:Tol biopolymer transport system component
MSKYHYIIFSLISLLIISSCTEVDLTQKRIGAYLGETPPDTVAKLFAPGLLSTGFHTRDLAISPDGDEIYFCVNIGSNTFMTMLFTRRINDEWTEPQVATFASDLRYFTIEPCISSNGQKLFFASNHPNSLGKDHNSDIWYVKREGITWGLPQNLGTTINTDAPEFFPSITKDGTLYFTRDDHKTGISYIYRSRFKQGAYSEPELLPEQINAGRSRFNAFITPDESFIIIPIFGMPDSYGATDYYVSFRNKDDQWSEPINLGNKINSKSRWEYSASISPDGKYLFFMSSKIDTSLVINHDIITMNDLRELASKPENGNPDIYWIEAAFIQKLRPEGF